MAEPVSRREWLKRAGLAGASILVLPGLSRVLLVRRDLLDRQSQPGGGSPAGLPLTFTEFATLDAICARLIPSDEDGPGAKEARAAEYINRALGSYLSSYRDEYSVALAAVNGYAHMKQPSISTFVELDAAHQDEILRDMEQDARVGSIPSSAAFFNLVRGHTLQGTFCDPIYGGNANMVGWDLIGYPGVRLTVAAGEQNMSTPPARNHKSAYDYVMFSKAGI
jgi:gluconate 2-dehydrogenase gamma chain